MHLVLPVLLALTNPSFAQTEPVVGPPSNRNYVAAVVGLSSYENLPDAVELDFGRSDAAMVAQALQREAFYTQVFLLTDGEATRDGIREVLRTEVPQLVGPNDVFVLYFVGHGLGADLDIPVFMASDSTMEKGQEDGLELGAFAQDLQTWIRADQVLIVTDVIHRNQLDGINFWGPAANEWPRMPKGTMLLSSSQARTPARDGAFGDVFARGIAGEADANRDSLVTAAELLTHLVNSLSEGGQIPAAAGDFDSTMVLAQGVVRAPPGVNDGTGTNFIIVNGTDPEPETDEVYPDYEIVSAKFVWKDGGAQSVRCRDEEISACAPSCYVRTFVAGPCQLQAVYDGVMMTGRKVVLGPGKYDCFRKGGELACTGP